MPPERSGYIHGTEPEERCQTSCLNRPWLRELGLKGGEREGRFPALVGNLPGARQAIGEREC